MKKKTWIIIATICILILVFIVVIKRHASASKTYTFETEKAVVGNISNTVTATGTLEAITTVEVGTQVSGVIDKIYVDFNSSVKQGQLLARIDETPLIAQLEQSKATVDEAEAELEYQESNYNRLKVLYEKKLIAQTDYDQAKYNYSRAKASLSSARSAYNRNKINLGYARIYSPIDGVVLNRAVDQGQTVAASFNTPTLFTIAKDLTQMQVEASVDEADIGKVKQGQRVEFTVDAYPDDKFEGKISEVRLQPTVTNNVVTYTVIIVAPNPEKKLMPGMTASTTIIVEEKKNTLTVPGKAVRFSPDKTLMSAIFQQNKDAAKFAENRNYQKQTAGTEPEYQKMTDNQRFQHPDMENNNLSTVWIKKGSEVSPKRITTGIDNGTTVEVLSGLKEGDEVILLMSEAKSKKEGEKAEVRSPFMPQRPGRMRKN